MEKIVIHYIQERKVNMKLINLNEINPSTIAVETIQVGQCFKFENEIYMMCAIGSLGLAEDLNTMNTLYNNVLAVSVSEGDIYLMEYGTLVIPVEVESTWKFIGKNTKGNEELNERLKG